MSNGLREVISAAVRESGRKGAMEQSGRQAPVLRAVEMSRVDAAQADAAAADPVGAAPRMRRKSKVAPGDTGQLGHDGLRLAFWLSGFHDALMERRHLGEQLTQCEESLLLLCQKDFERIRPLVIKLTLQRLRDVLNAPDLSAASAASGVDGSAQREAFALHSLRSLSSWADRLLRKNGPEAALALFGQSASVRQPLAIFQLVFASSLGLVEAFQQIAPASGARLSRLAFALDSEVSRI